MPAKGLPQRLSVPLPGAWPARRPLRLTDAVVVAALVLLALKGLSLLAPGRGEELPPADGLPPFARVLAHARTNYVPPEISVTGSVPEKDQKGGAPAPAAKPQDPKQDPKSRPASLDAAPVSPSERAILERLGERRDVLQQRARDMDTRERLLENAERKLDGRINELKTLEEKADGPAAKRAEADAGLKNLVLMYETMKPKEAARVFDRLPQDVLVPVVLAMNPRKMAEVLAAMAPESAEKLTIALATRARSPAPAVAGAALPPTELPAIEPSPQRR